MTFLLLQMILNLAVLIAIIVLAQRTGLIDTHLSLSLIYVADGSEIHDGIGLFELVVKQFGDEFTTFAAGSMLITIPIAILALLFKVFSYQA